MPAPLGVAAPDPWHALRALTPARIALGRAGAGLPTAAHLDFQLAHARARDAVHDALDVPRLQTDLHAAGFDSVAVHSAAPDRAGFLQRPDLGRRLDSASHDRLISHSGAGEGREVVFVVADGLSARAAQHHAVPVLTAVAARATHENLSIIAPVVIAEQGRVALGDEVGSLLGAALVVVLLGERPGLSSPDSLGAYLTWDPRPGRTDADRNCISNIRPGGLGYELAAGKLGYLMTEARRRLSGVRLKDDTGLLGA